MYTACSLSASAHGCVVRRQEVFLAALFAAYFEGDVTRLAEGQHKIPEYTKFYPFSVSLTEPRLPRR